MIVLSDEERGLISRLRTFERRAQRSRIPETVRKKWMFWADILRNQLSYKSEFLECVLDRYIDRIHRRLPAVLSLRLSEPTLLADHRRKLLAAAKISESGGVKR